MLSVIALLTLVPQQLLVPVPEPIHVLIDAGKATVTAARHDIGEPRNIFDGQRNTLYRTPSINPAEVAISFTEPQEARNFRIVMHMLSEFRIEAADSVHDLETKAGSYLDITGLKQTDDEGEAIVRLQTPVTRKVYRLWAHRLRGDDYVHIYEWQFCDFAPAESIDVEMIPMRPEWKPSDIIPANGIVRMRATAKAQGAGLDVTGKADWSGDGFTRNPEFGPNAWQADRPGPGSITANAGRARGTINFTIENWERTNTRQDVNVLFIELQPRRDYDADNRGNGPGWPASGDQVTWIAHVQSHNRRAGNIPYKWILDGEEIGSGVIRAIDAGEVEKVFLIRTWEQFRRKLQFRIEAPEWDANPHNNSREIHTNALSVGFWVEEKMWDHWHDNQHKQNPRNETFEDWANYMVETWNRLMEAAVYPSITPNGVTDRWRLDRVWIVPSGALPMNGGLPSNNPDSRDKTTDIAWGFATDPDGKISDYWSVRERSAFDIDWALIHELMHARYIADSYGFDVHAKAIKVEVDGKPLIGGLLPENFARFNKYKCIMGGGIPHLIGEHSAGALERVQGMRARGGNMNSPTVRNEYFNDLPRRNVFQFLLPSGEVAADAEVLVWRAKPAPTEWYGKLYEGEPAFRLATDLHGRVELGQNPFAEGRISHGFGHADSVLLALVRHGGRTYVHFQEVTDFNIAFWRGDREAASYTVRLAAPPGVSE